MSGDDETVLTPQLHPAAPPSVLCGAAASLETYAEVESVVGDVQGLCEGLYHHPDDFYTDFGDM